jgi:cytochrome d ubiquinol oxidase subunit I
MDDPVFLARLQFALTIGFHYLFPPLTIGLGVLLVIMEGTFLRTRNYQYEAMAKFWTKIFGLIFAIGVASGIVMEFQFGTNWATYSRYVGDIFGAALAAEGIFAFFLESGFLAVLVFGWDRVSAGMHFFATCMVSLGSIFSAIWIIVANSWQQTPAGFELVAQRLPGGAEITVAQLTNFWEAVFNHSTLARLSHVLIGAMLAGAFLVLSVSSYYLLRGRHEDFARRGIRIAMPFALVFALLALVTGHWQGQNVAEHQPAKLAAMEGHYETSTNAPLHAFGITDDAAGRVRYGLALPGMLSFLAHNKTDASVWGLHEFPPEDRPPVQLTFQAFHLMVGLGMFMLVVTLAGTVLLLRDRLFQRRAVLWLLVFAILAPMAANQLGWIVAEVGRQPWIVYPKYDIAASGFAPIGGLRTAHAASKAVDATEIVISMVLVGITYSLLLIVWLYVLDHKIRAGPEAPAELAAAAARRKQGWVDTAAEFTDPGGRSLTDAHQDRPEGDRRR